MYEDISDAVATKAHEVTGSKRKGNTDKLSQETKDLLSRRRDMAAQEKHNTPEYRELCKSARKKMKTDIRNFNTEHVRREIENNRSVKKAKRSLVIGKNQIIQMKEEDGTIINDRDRIIKRAEEFYQDLYDSKTPVPDVNLVPEHEEEDILDVGADEVEAALKSMNNGKSPGPDDIVAEMLKCGGDTVIQALANSLRNV
ncbi:uncharacterized protein [Amphiura filiformis]|uniref:uncharacterized protein n=1 Tax=Amphiura filiformis TaxID=82378 RepID=UPI003B21E0D7